MIFDIMIISTLRVFCNTYLYFLSYILRFVYIYNSMFVFSVINCYLQSIVYSNCYTLAIVFQKNDFLDKNIYAIVYFS